MGSLAVAGLVSGLGGAGRASALLSLGDHVDLQLNLGLAAWASGAALFTLGAGVAVHRSRHASFLEAIWASAMGRWARCRSAGERLC